MKISCHRHYTGDKGVAISIYPPVDWTGMRFRALAPTPSIFHAKKAGMIDEKEYDKRYREEVLAKLDPNEIYKMFKDHVLLCWEPPGQFCHRRIVAAWLYETIGVYVPEWTPNDIKIEQILKSKNIKPLF